MRSLARSEVSSAHRRPPRVDPAEVASLIDDDAELRALVYDRHKRRWRRQEAATQSDTGAPVAATITLTHYGLV